MRSAEGNPQLRRSASDAGLDDGLVAFQQAIQLAFGQLGPAGDSRSHSGVLLRDQGISPSCCISVSTSSKPMCSTILPSATRTYHAPLNRKRAAVACQQRAEIVYGS